MWNSVPHTIPSGRAVQAPGEVRDAGGKPIVVMAASGTTRLYGLIGDPLHAARSPQLFNELFAEHRLDAVCIPLNVKAGDLRQFVTGARTLRNLAALLVTTPHKAAMLQLVDVLDPTSRQAKVTNVIRCDANGNWTGATF